MTPPTSKLTLAPYLQTWDEARKVLVVRVMTVPVDDPRAPLSTGWAVPTSPSFDTARLVLRAHVGVDAGRLPTLADVAPEPSPTTLEAAAHARSIFDAFAARFPITKPAEAHERSASMTMRKYLPPSYRTSHAFVQPRTRLALTDDTYRCALNCPPSSPPDVTPPPPDLTWGEIFAVGMRKSQVARAMGFIHEIELDVGDRLRDGGWLFFTLDATSDFAAQQAADARFVKTFATRVPRLVSGVARPVFTPVLFPVAATAADAAALGSYDAIFREALRFDDGFARIVHARQPATADVNAESTIDELRPLIENGVQLAWDDEDILISQNRGVGTDWDGTPLPEAPRGIFGYRVDIRAAGSSTWASLCKVRSDGLRVGDAVVPAYVDELRVEVHPSTVDGRLWLPPYFTRLRTHSLVASTPDQRLLLGRFDDVPDVDQPDTDEVPPLRYGKRYELRVRLVDPTGGGPGASDAMLHEGEAPVASLLLQRFVPMTKVRLETVTPSAGALPTAVRVTRPTIGYPAAVFAGVPDAESRLAALARASVGGAADVDVGLPDPDARYVELEVLVRHPAFDTGTDDDGYRRLYTTYRAFPSDPKQHVEIAVAWRDCNRLDDVSWPAGSVPWGTDTGALELPTGREVLVVARAAADNDLVRLGDEAIRFGEPVRLTESPMYAAPSAAPPLVEMAPDDAITSVFLLGEAPSAADTATAAPQVRASAELVRRLAQAANLSVDEVTLFGAEGRRTVFGCSGLRHSFAPDRSSLTLTSLDELPDQWLNVIRFPIERDWSFLGLETEAVRLTRTIERVGAGLPALTETLSPIALSHAVNRQATLGKVDRDRFEICYVDAFSPPLAAGRPHELRIRYELTLRLRGGVTQTFTVENHLPVTTRPTQVPVVVSCGHAFGEYTIGEDYASTGLRQRALWIELDAPPADPRDAYFVRVVAGGPDPMLLPDYEPVVDPPPPSPPVLPEPVRVVRPGQADDFAGLGGMQRLVPSADSDRHYLVPLPPNLAPDAPELFGFFTYEIVVGHDRGTPERPFWSTGTARYGTAVVLDGVQHPPPPLRCAVTRTDGGLRLFAEHASPVLDGSVVTPTPPHTELWGVLYGRVVQADGSIKRNVELGVRRFTLVPRPRVASPKTATPADRAARAFCDVARADLEAMLAAWGLPSDAPVSALAVELLPEPNTPFTEPLSRELGNVRILRVSPLVSGGHDCC
ncbi:MAG: hypothetical protein KF764_26715 [Labilithrix sp.]|nr:hypothetical protein [Labilithrix sp.]